MPAVPRPKGKAKDIAASILGKKNKRSQKAPLSPDSQVATEKNIRQRVEVDDAYRNRY
jgi:hypothetical protein